MANLAIDFLDVGQGDATFLSLPDGYTMLVDFGSTYNASVSAPSAVETIVDQVGADNNIDLLVITHSDADHHNQLWRLDEAMGGTGGWTFPFDEVAIGGEKDEYDGDYIEALLDHMEANGTLITFGDAVTNGTDPWFTTDNVSFYVLSANYPSVASAAPNPKSVVLMVSFEGVKVILGGDAEKATEKYIVNTNYADSPDFLSSYGLKIGHHGSKGGTCKEWVEAVEPAAVFASGDQQWAHPYCDAINRVKLWSTVQEDPDFDHGWVCGGRFHGENTYFNHSDSEYIFTTIMVYDDGSYEGGAAAKPYLAKSNITYSEGTVITLTVDENDGQCYMQMSANLTGLALGSGWYDVP